VSLVDDQVRKALRCLHWLPFYGWQWLTRPRRRTGMVHLLIGVADHFEPAIVPELPGTFASADEQERRLEQWCAEYPEAVGHWRDADGYPLRHTYFYPAEQYDKTLIDRLAEHCRSGWGEIEIHLHHGVKEPDTAWNTRRVLVEFRDRLARLGCLSRWNGEGPPRYAFVHGNWALANSGGGRACGVDEEMEILAQTGCYADLTLPSAPNPAQVTKINALYECARPLHEPAPHRKGRDLRRGQLPCIFPLIIQGPLGLDLARWPFLENGELTTLHPPTMHRLRLWCRPAITVMGRPDWLFIKLHCHGMNPRDKAVMLGAPLQQFLRSLTTEVRAYRIHFVTAREMVNMILAACDGREGNPGIYRDYRLRLNGQTRQA